MKKTFYSLLFVMFASIALFSCEEGTVGSSLAQNKVEIMMDSSFTISGESVINEKIQSRTITQLLGKIQATDFGVLNSDFVTQFMPAQAIDTVGVTAATMDSVKLILTIANGGYVGDSIAPMRVGVYQLNKQLPSPIYSDFNPKDYYSHSDILGSTSYAATVLGQKDSLATLSYRQVKIDMPKELGAKMYNEYKNNPQTFASPSAFAKFFPGVYVTTTYGNGRMMNVETTEMNFYYHKTVKVDDKDTTYSASTVLLATTPEIVTNNNISLNMAQSVKALVAQGKSVIQAPAGLDVNINFPIKAIFDKYNEMSKNNVGVVNNLYFEIPAETLSTEYKINPPSYLLLVRRSEKSEFFSSNSITDDISSYYAQYSSSKKAYIFSDMRGFLLDIINTEDGKITEDDEQWVLTPVSLTTETNSSTSTTTITNITPYIDGPAITVLDLKKAKIRLTVSRKSLNN